MPSRSAELHLRDILERIVHVEAFLAGPTYEDHAGDLKTGSAVERQPQSITEAACRLGDEAEIVCPGPDWRSYRGMGNILRHSSHRVDDRIVWNTATEELPSRRVAAVRALGVLGPPSA